MAAAPTPYANSAAASAGLIAAFNPTGGALTPAQQAAIDAASSLVPTQPGAPIPPPVKGVTTPTDTAATTDAATTEAANGQSALDLAGNTNSNSSPSFISTSDSVVADENNTMNTVNNLNANNQATTDAHNSYIDTLNQEQQQLQQQLSDQTANINQDFNEQESTQGAKDAADSATENAVLLRSGGYLGMGASQVGALSSLNASHALDQSSLETKRQTAIQTANSAVDAKEYTIADAAAKEATAYQAAMQKNQQDYITNKAAIVKQGQDTITFAQTQAQTQLTGLSNMTPDELAAVPKSTLDSIDQAYGVQGFAQSYIDVTSAANSAKTASDLIDAQQKLLTLLQDIPQGQKVTFPDPTDPTGAGTTYTGMGKVGDIATFNETDNYGNVTIVSYNKSTGTVTRTPAGAIGKTSAAVDTAQQTGIRLGNMEQFMTDPQNKILIPADPSNPNSPSYMTADNYVAMFQKYVKQYPGQADEFLKQWPVEQFVLPSQRKSTELNSFSQTDPLTNPSPTASLVNDGTGSGTPGQ